MANSGSPSQGVSATFVREVSEKIKRLSKLTERHGIELDPGLTEKAEALKTQVRVRGAGERLASASALSTASDRSTSARTGSKHRFSGSETMLSEAADRDEELSQSFASSIYSTESQRQTAKQLAQERVKEIRQIRGETKAVQQTLRSRVQELRREALGVLSPASDFEHELEFYDGQLEQMKQVVSNYVSEPHSCERSPSPPLFRPVAQDPLLTELLSLRTDIAALKKRVLEQEALRARSDGSNKELEEQLSVLKTTMEELTDRKRYEEPVAVAQKDGKCEVCATF